MRKLVMIRGGGDIGTGSIHRLHHCGFRQLILECEHPTAIRRKVAFCEAVYDGIMTVEGVTCRRISNILDCNSIWDAGEIPLFVDETASILNKIKPDIFLDAILAKKNLGTNIGMGNLTIGLGPGFIAGQDVDFVIETMRGHNLGRIISAGSAQPNTGVPGMIAGVGKERVIHSPAFGRIHTLVNIGDWVKEGQILATVGEVTITAKITGVLRGLIRDGFYVTQGLKIIDIDPRETEVNNCFTISDKSRCIAGSVLEVILHDLSGQRSYNHKQAADG